MVTGERLLTALEELVKPEHTGLVVIDMQNDFCHREGFFGKRESEARGQQQKQANLSYIEDMIPNLIHLIDVARLISIKTYFVHSFHDDRYLPPMYRLTKVRIGRKGVLCPEGKWGSEQFEGFEPKPGDNIITKYVHSSFIGSNFEDILKRDKIKSLIITGVNTDVCCESTIRDGAMLGFYIIVPRDCVGTHTIESHEGALTRIDRLWGVVTTSQEVMATWKSR